jgi:uncharacterized membrane protein YbhN (UPF0104 family)
MSLALLAALAFFCIVHWSAIVDSLFRFDALALVIAATTLGLQWCVGAWRDVLLVRRLTPRHVSVARVFILNSHQYVFNLLPLAMGTLLKAKRYRGEMGVPYTQFGSMFLVQYFVLVCVSTAWGIAAAVWLGHLPLAMLFSVVMVAAIACLFAPGRIAQWSPRFAKQKLLELHEGLTLILSSSRTFPGVVCLGVVCHALQCIRLYALLRCVDPTIVLSDSLLYAAMAHLSLLLMITPSGLGVREFLYAVVANVANHSVVATVLVALVERVLAIGLAIGAIVANRAAFKFVRDPKQ